MTDEQLDELGPIDYIVIEWPGRQPTGEAAPLILDLVDRGIIRILDVAFMVKDEDGNVAGTRLERLRRRAEFSEFEGASSGLLGDEDLDEAANALEPGTSRRGTRVGEPLGRARRHRAAALRRPARRQRPHPRPGHPRPARSGRSRLLDRKDDTMPGLLRGVARTAVIAGTATSVSNRVSRRQANRWSQQEAEQQQASSRSTSSRRRRPPPPADGPDRAAQEARRTCTSRAILTDEEFAAQKAKILG